MNDLKGLLKEKVADKEKVLSYVYSHERKGIFTRKTQNRFTMRRAVVATICLMFLSVTIVYGNEITAYLFGTENEGLKEALSYDYIQNLETNYIKSDGAGVKIDHMIMDDTNFALVFHYKFDEKINDADDILLSDLKIMDEKNNIIFEDGNEACLTTSYTKELADAAKDNRNIIQSLLLVSNQNQFPKSDKILISFSTIKIFHNNKLTDTIKGDWSYEIKADDKFAIKEDIEYHSDKNSDVKILRAKLTPTGFDIKMEFKDSINAELLAGNMLLTDEEGVEYKMAESLSATSEDSKPIIHANFQTTKFNASDHYQLIINTDKKIIVNLYK